LTNYPDFFGLSKESASNLLERFNAYTWNEHKPNLRGVYMSALKKALFVADKRFGGWKAFNGTPNLAKSIDLFDETSDFSQLKNIHTLRKENQTVKELELEIEIIPPEKLRDLFSFTREGRKRYDLRLKMVKELEPKMKESSQRIVNSLIEIGKEYRKNHIEKYYLHFL